MSYLIAVTGKGGVGKTTTSALLIRMLLEQNAGPVLAVDADPNSSLAPLLGLTVEQTMSVVRDQVLKEKSRVTGIPKERLLQMKLEECILEASGFDLLTMGHPEGPTCYCYVNNLVRTALTSLKANYPVTVIDNEAGMEHLSRMNTSSIDCMVFVSEPTVSSAQAIRRIWALSQNLPVAVHRRVLVWNKVRPSGVPAFVQDQISGCAFDGTVLLPMNEGVEDLSVAARSVFSLSLPGAFLNLVEAIGVSPREDSLVQARG